MKKKFILVGAFTWLQPTGGKGDPEDVPREDLPEDLQLEAEGEPDEVEEEEEHGDAEEQAHQEEQEDLQEEVEQQEQPKINVFEDRK